MGRVEAETSLPIINLPQEVGKEIKRAGLQSVFLLATEGTMKSNVYQNVCSAYGVDCIEPNGDIQALVSRVIDEVKGNNMSRANSAALEISDAIRQSGADGVILGCTELPLVSKALVPEGCSTLDTLDILADAAIRYVSKDPGKD
jgi:aspartate racemase